MNKSKLADEISRFKKWAEGQPLDRRAGGEWECDYEDWDAIYEAFAEYLKSTLPEKWSEEDRIQLLYIVARDNEMQNLQRMLENHPDHLLALAKAALATSSDDEAKYQLADALSKLKDHRQAALDLLELLVVDSDEYVSRRALMSLGRLKSPMLERFVSHAWDTNHEYQRMAALEALKDSASPLLDKYLVLAKQDGRTFLVQLAQKLESTRTDER